MPPMTLRTRSTNEDGAVIITYTDKDDRTVYENRQLRNGSVTENIITYYAYTTADVLRGL